MKLVVGLGNPGRQYAKTRHNVGFRVLDLLAERLGVEVGRKKFKGLYGAAPAPGGGEELLLVKPQTYMNLSGETVQGYCGYYQIPLSALLVVVDDVALAVGCLRLRPAGSAGGHNGLKDIILRLGSDEFARLRIGVGGRTAQTGPALGGPPDRPELVQHVLGRFGPQDEAVLQERLPLAAEACLIWAGQGLAAAMNRYNSPKGE